MKENQKRFKIEKLTDDDLGGEYEIIVDLSTYRVIDGSSFMSGFRRSVGREPIGFYGNNEVIVGQPDDVVFYPMGFCDGYWGSVEGRGVRETSGKGILWAQLEEFWQLTHKEEAA
ncbi:MAG TPA: hypothetical protein VJS44_08245 [Pyrinomonadaceae bacterium]|nr:hypothetical protein [Pyrinomonadaceae bacterium]